MKKFVFLLAIIFISLSVFGECGNNLVEMGEACDGTNVNGYTCLTVAAGFVSGELVCASDCKSYETSNCVQGQIIQAESCNFLDVENAINNSSEGSIILVPEGECTWNQTLTVTKSIVLKGKGRGKTIINADVGVNVLNGLIHYAPGVNKPFTLSGFTFNSNSLCNGVKISHGNTLNPLRNISINNNEFYNAGGDNAGRNLIFSGTVYGVVFNNLFHGTGKMVDSYGSNKSSWDNLVFEFGTGDNIFYEDNNLIIVTTPSSAGAGGRYVARYNTYTNLAKGINPWFDIHGNGGIGGNYSSMGAEIYGNKMYHNYATAGVTTVDQRGGKALVYGNKVIKTNSNNLKAREENDDSIHPTTNPQPQHVSESYYWRNIYTKYYSPNIDVLATAYTAQTLDYPPLLQVPQINREYFSQQNSFDGTTGVGCGELSSRPLTCTSGVAYWATDQNCLELNENNVGMNPVEKIEGTLYKCNDSNEWEDYYKSYPYPHPLSLIEISDTPVLCKTNSECNDENPCTNDLCDPANPNSDYRGCYQTNNTNTCDDQNPCTINDVCSLGNCSGTIDPLCVDLEYGLIAHYPFNENTNDESENNNDGIGVGFTGNEYSQDGKLGKGVKLSENKYINTTKIIPSIDVRKGSISMWINADSYYYYNTTNQGGIIGIGAAASSDGLGIAPISSTSIAFYYRENNNTKLARINNAPIKEWYHVVGVWGENNISIYLNGELVETIAQGNTISASLSQSKIGADFFGTMQSYFTGTIDEVRIYDKILNQAEITSLYNQTALPPICQYPERYTDLPAINVEIRKWFSGENTIQEILRKIKIWKYCK